MSNDDTDDFYVLVTGANSGLGFAICCRLIDEFLQTRPQSHTLHLLPTVRSQAKADDTVSRLCGHLYSTLAKYEQGKVLPHFTHKKERPRVENEGVQTDGEDASATGSQKQDGVSGPKWTQAKVPGLARLLERRVKIHPQLVDLMDLVSVRQLSLRLSQDETIPKLDAVIWNAGMGGWDGLNWPMAVWHVLTDTVEATTRPVYKIGVVGGVCKKMGVRYPKENSAEKGSEKLKAKTRQDDDDEPPLGEIFTSNVFGHYMLGHWLVPLLSQGQGGRGGRMIWVGSLEADTAPFDANVDTDIQALNSNVAYEDLKRLSDILALTADLPSTKRWTNSYFSFPLSGTPPSSISQQQAGHLQTTQPTPSPSRPQIHMQLTHPGIFGSTILPIPSILIPFMNLAFYLARLLGSIWHPVTPYKAATAPVWVALTDGGVLGEPDDENDEPMARRGKSKWGSATDVWGNERVERTEVDGWGLDGTLPEDEVQVVRARSGEEGEQEPLLEQQEVVVRKRRKGRWRNSVDLTEERRVEFEEVGRKCWSAMEELRVEWEERVEAVIGRIGAGEKGGR